MDPFRRTIVIVGLIASLITIFVFFTGKNLPQFGKQKEDTYSALDESANNIESLGYSGIVDKLKDLEKDFIPNRELKSEKETYLLNQFNEAMKGYSYETSNKIMIELISMNSYRFRNYIVPALKRFYKYSIDYEPAKISSEALIYCMKIYNIQNNCQLLVNIKIKYEPLSSVASEVVDVLCQ